MGTIIALALFLLASALVLSAMTLSSAAVVVAHLKWGNRPLREEIDPFFTEVKPIPELEALFKTTPDIEFPGLPRSHKPYVIQAGLNERYQKYREHTEQDQIVTLEINFHTNGDLLDSSTYEEYLSDVREVLDIYRGLVTATLTGEVTGTIATVSGPRSVLKPLRDAHPNMFHVPDYMRAVDTLYEVRAGVESPFSFPAQGAKILIED